MKVLDPTDETQPAQRSPIERPETLDGLVVGLLDISKARGNVFLDRARATPAARGASRPGATPSRRSRSRHRSTFGTRSPSSATW